MKIVVPLVILLGAAGAGFACAQLAIRPPQGPLIESRAAGKSSGLRVAPAATAAVRPGSESSSSDGLGVSKDAAAAIVDVFLPMLSEDQLADLVRASVKGDFTSQKIVLDLLL